MFLHFQEIDSSSAFLDSHFLSLDTVMMHLAKIRWQFENTSWRYPFMQETRRPTCKKSLLGPLASFSGNFYSSCILHKLLSSSTSIMVVVKGQGLERDGLGVWAEEMQTGIYRMDDQENSTVLRGTLQYVLINQDGKEYKRMIIGSGRSSMLQSMGMQIVGHNQTIEQQQCISESLCCIAVINTTL